MKRFIEDIILTLGEFADAIKDYCLFIILLVVVWDTLKTGYMGFFEYAVGWKGILVITICCVFIWISASVKKYLE